MSVSAAADVTTPGSGQGHALEVVALSKTFAGGRALDEVHLDVGRGEVHALLGENGSGKSTLIKVLAGYHRPDAGGVVRIGDRELSFGSALASHELGARFVHQDLGLIETSSVGDNLSFGQGFPTSFGTIRRATARQRAERALAGVELDLDPEMLVGALSPAQKTGVAVARALMSEEPGAVRLLVLDEPTARLPEAEVEHLLEIVRSVCRRDIGVLYVTHRLDEVYDIAARATVLRDGHRVAMERVEGLTREALLGHLLGAALEQPHKSEAEQQRRPDVLTVQCLSSEVLQDVSFSVRAGEVVGIAGITGSGREALCASIFGGRPRDAGEVLVSGDVLAPGRPDLAMGLGAAYVPAERKLQGCFVDLTARENLSISSLSGLWGRVRLSRRKEVEQARRWFGRFDVRPSGDVDKPVSAFSGGNQQKIVFGKWFQRKPSLFLLDEPTQGVDVGAKAELHAALFEAARGGAGVLMASSDVEELTTTCDRILVMRAGRLVAELSGSDINPHAMSRAGLGLMDDEAADANQGDPL